MTRARAHAPSLAFGRVGPGRGAATLGSGRGPAGRSGDPHDIRRFEPGDAIDRLDLRAYRRFRAYHVRERLDEAPRPATLFIDRSPSMRGVTGERARSTNAWIALVTEMHRRSHDPLRIVPCDDGRVPRRASPRTADRERLAIFISDALGVTRGEDAVLDLARHGRPLWICPWERDEWEPTASRGLARLRSSEPADPAIDLAIGRQTLEVYRTERDQFRSTLERSCMKWFGAAAFTVASDPIDLQVRAALRVGLLVGATR